jgi:hypothetical protein
MKATKLYAVGGHRSGIRREKKRMRIPNLSDLTVAVPNAVENSRPLIQSGEREKKRILPIIGQPQTQWLRVRAGAASSCGRLRIGAWRKDPARVPDAAPPPGREAKKSAVDTQKDVGLPGRALQGRTAIGREFSTD